MLLKTTCDTASGQKLKTSEVIIVLFFVALFGIFAISLNKKYKSERSRSDIRFMQEMHNTMCNCEEAGSLPSIEF